MAKLGLETKEVLAPTCVLNHNIILPLGLKHFSCTSCCSFCLQSPCPPLRSENCSSRAQEAISSQSPKSRASFVGRFPSTSYFKYLFSSLEPWAGHMGIGRKEEMAQDKADLSQGCFTALGSRLSTPLILSKCMAPALRTT